MGCRPAGPRPATPGASPSPSGGGPCFRCGGDHFARDCPQSAGRPRPSTPRPGGGGRFNGFVLFGDAEPQHEQQSLMSLDELGDLGHEGLMILDSGATTHVSGLRGAEALRDASYAAGLEKAAFDTNQKSTFGFGNGAYKSTLGKATIKADIGDITDLEINVLDAAAPPLLGVSLLNNTKAIVDFGDEPGIWFHGADGPKTPCRRLRSGHLAVRVSPSAGGVFAVVPHK